MPLFSREKSSLKGRWRLETVQDMRSSGSNLVSCSETPIKIYGSKEEIRARKSPETVDAPGFAPDASIPVTLYGTPDWIRTSGLQSRSYQTVKPQTVVVQGFGRNCTNFRRFMRKPRNPCGARASEVFRSSSQIVVWIKCGFSSPVQLNIFTLYPWIRSAASHPSTLARSSTIPACAFASSYCFCS